MKIVEDEKKKRKKKSESKQKFIVNKAQNLFGRFGLAKTSMDDIATACGMGKSSLYYYFKSKEDVFAAVIRAEVAGFQMIVEKELEGVDSPQEQLHKYVSIRMSYLKERVNSYTTILDEYLKNYAFIDSIRKDFTKQEIGFIASILQSGVDKKIFAIENIESIEKIASGIYYALKGFEEPVFLNHKKFAPEEIIDTLLSVLFTGILNRGEENESN